MWVSFDLSVSVILESSKVICICLKMACNSKMAGRRAKLSEIWDLG